MKRLFVKFEGSRKANFKLRTALTYLFLSLNLVLFGLFSGGTAFASERLRIGYYGGTFDPPTLGHLSLAERARIAGKLDLIYVMASITNSRKPNMTSYNLRKEMLRLGFQAPHYVHADPDLETAFRTDRATGILRLLMQRHPGAKIMRLTGDDVISRNYTPELENNPEFNDVGFIIGARAGDNRAKAEALEKFNLSGREVIWIPDDTDEGYSSTLVRTKLHELNPTILNFTHTSIPENIPVTKDVFRFIYEHRLYMNAPECGTVFKKAANER